ncbi:nucleoside triphosphate hydrolase protein [Wolfiporia cocos MD-104 SS10]|uniref:Nucleoside triphosphate hydrolase protein n=1 Tax=Wolfiporia cocos (strain MD-104) TaxID=742152 RepID=A0A2H3J9C7_WOLCO|nr:nucleoside triphosphate hydrolase protein [Wolfiporia cocos MD-104 SS10]
MPPKRGIVKSGNVGNSSKPSKQPAAATSAPEEKPLFPPGSKYPLSLLHERCQKNGWEKPVVDTRKQGDGFSFVVTLSRVNKKDSQRESVRLEPHPPYVRPTALEARHWGATYALYRFCNEIQLNRVLLPGPREYWAELAAAHKVAPEHQRWVYAADPFAARKSVEERQAAAAQRRAASNAGTRTSDSGQGSRPTISREFENAPEAKMATALRDLVEIQIKKVQSLHPESGESQEDIIGQEDAPRVLQELGTLGFNAAQAQRAVTALSRPSALTSSLLSTLPPLQACIEYLVLQIPECDLPQRFVPSANSSGSFVTSTHSGSDDLQQRWLEDKAVKECGWPAHAVKECLSDATLPHGWGSLLSALNGRLIGLETNQTMDDNRLDNVNIDEEEVESFGGRFTADSELIVPLPVAPLKLVIVLSDERSLPIHGVPPPMFISSPSVAAYIRLRLLSVVLLAFHSGTLIDEGETFITGTARVIEEEWASIEDNGPPEISTVLKHMMPQERSTEVFDDETIAAPPSTRSRNQRRRQPRKREDRTDAQIKEQFMAICKSEEYSRILTPRKKLPAFSAQDQFLQLLEQHRCVVVVGETGCGKTTQLPQFILDSMILAGRGSEASIIVTQPRRLSALGVAARVSAERLEDDSVGYAIRGESKQNGRTKLLFCTTGVVLRRLGSGDRLQDVTHVIVDEVHERSVDGDFLLLELKELLKVHRHLKVVLMSATINHERFVEYFDNAPLLAIPGFTHPVEDRYLEDFIPLIGYRPTSSFRTRKGREVENEQKALYNDLTERGLDEDSVKAVQAISRTDKIDHDLIYSVVEYIISTAPKQGAILIFLPGLQDIRQCIEKLRGIAKAKVLPLHANLSNDEQRLVFAAMSEWKIIAATNVAETSITIDDVLYVIDSGKAKETCYDPEKGLANLEEQWVTRAAAKQRRGRAGRTQPGVCYKLYTRMQENMMNAFPMPEIKRVPLESIALTVKIVRNDVKSFLSRALDPPDIVAMDKALAVLRDLSAIDQNEEVTPLGRHMAMLPVDLRLGKMLVLGTIFKCLGPVLTIAACLSSKPIFLSPMDKRDEANRARSCFARGNSDLLTDMHAYEECSRLRNEGKSQSAIKSFCEENFISPSTVRDITSFRQDFLSSLSELGFIPRDTKPTDTALNANSSNNNLLKSVILGAFWPRIARVSLPRSAIKFDRVQAGTVQRENTAKEFKFYDQDGRVFLHPASILFGEATWKSPFLTYFQKQATTKVYLRDATEVPVYGLLLFGGPVTVHHIGGGLTVGNDGAAIKLKASPRIGVLVNQLRRLLDIRLKECIDGGMLLDSRQSDPVSQAMLALLENDGLTS